MTHKHVIMIESSITVDSGVFQSIEVKDSRVVDPSFAENNVMEIRIYPCYIKLILLTSKIFDCAAIHKVNEKVMCRKLLWLGGPSLTFL